MAVGDPVLLAKIFFQLHSATPGTMVSIGGFKLYSRCIDNSRAERMSEIVGWTAFVGGFVLPLLHVAISPRGGPYRRPPGARCPIGPRVGWLVLVLMFGPIGWLVYIARRPRRAGGTG